MGRREVELSPLEPGHVRMYTCGPTVYNAVHIGNLRTFLWEDVLRRHLKASGLRVTQVMNLTDVDDKTIRGAQQAGLPLRDYTAKYAELFFRDIDRLGFERAELYPRAHRPRARDAGNDGEAARARARVRVGRLGLLPDLDLPGLRKAFGNRPDAGAARRARRRRRVREGGRQGLRPLEGGQAGRALVEIAVGAGKARLAHRVLGDEPEVPGDALRHPYGRRGQHLSAPRERDRAERGGDRPALRERLAPRGAPDRGRREDGQVQGELLHARRRARAAQRPGRGAVFASLRSLSNEAEFHLGRAHAGGGVGRAHQVRAAPHRRGGRLAGHEARSLPGRRPRASDSPRNSRPRSTTT